MFVSFRVADFRYLALSTLAVGYGQWAQQIGLFWLVFQFTDSPAQLGFLAAFRGGVGIVVSPLGGVLADRQSRRSIMIWSTLAGAVLAGFIVVMVIADLVQVWHLYVFAFFGGILQSINMPTRQAFVYDVSTDETLSNAIAMNSIVQNVSRVSGPPLAGALIGFFGVAAPFIFIAVMHLVAVAVTLMISQQTRQVRIGSGGGMLLQMLEGFRYCWRDRRIMGLIVVTAIPSVLIVPYIPFMAVISEQVLGRGPEGFGLLASMLGWGSILGLFLLAFLGDIRRKGLVMLGCETMYALLVIGFAWSEVFYLSLAFLAAAGIFHSVGRVLGNTLIQLAAPNEMRGRVMSVWQMSHGLQPLGSLPMGLAVARFGPQLGLGMFMVAAFVSFIVFTLTWPSVRRM